MNSKTKKNTIPTFDNREDEAKFWETHSIADLSDELKPVKVRFAKNLSQGITIRFDQPTLHKLREIASNKGLGPTTLARMWILEHLRKQA
ncbi:MAG TPA: CopG family antitoxin [Candidatus Saccharimonadales bacterium]|nr:CopG family antitoxin [Candidatus Saccharimonadales bacterium]